MYIFRKVFVFVIDHKTIEVIRLASERTDTSTANYSDENEEYSSFVTISAILNLISTQL